jgi:RND family efflux transporter MFP subunit
MAAAVACGTAAAQAPPPPVTVANPLEKKIKIWDEYSGRFEAVESVEIRARVSGYIDKIHFRDGEIVKAGDVLYTIDPRPFEIAAESARADIARMKAQMALAENEVDRARPLIKSGAVTERELDQRVSALSVMRAQMAGAEAALKNAELNLEWTVVKAPITGRISDTKVDVGNLISGGNVQTTLLTTIVSLDPIHFVFDVSESDFLRYERMRGNGNSPSSQENANPVLLKLADEEGWKHEGVMDFVDNQINARSGTIRGRAIFANEEQLFLPGVFARLRLFGGEMEALLIPDSAVISDQTRKVVFAVGDDDVVKAVQVTLGTIDDGLRIVRDGLRKTDRIIINGLANPFVRPGTKVTPEPGEIKAAAAH